MSLYVSLIRRKKKIVAFMMVLALCVSSVVYTSYAETSVTNSNDPSSALEADENDDLNLSMSEKQQNALSMLNYLTVLSQEINASSNSKLYLDHAYSDIVNNINPNAIDADSLSQIKSLLNTIYAYQSIETKRERLQYIYEQNQADAVQKAIPNPLSVLNVVHAGNPAKSLLSIVYLATDSVNSYKSYLSEVERDFIEDGWQLDDSAANNLHESRKDAFSYMVEMCQKYDLDGKLALNEKSVEDFVQWENENNEARKIASLEDNQSTYKAYGKYWLVLAKAYYDKEEYKKCLDAISKYEKMHINTFRKDHDFAKAMVVALAAADVCYKDNKYVTEAEKYLSIMLENAEQDDWMLRYSAAQTYMDLYSRTKQVKYLQKAYDIAKSNVNYLIDTQQTKNNEYLKEVEEKDVPKNATKEQKKEIKQYNKMVKEERKTALPPVYQPLVLNCDLLFGLADQLKIKDKEKANIDDMLHSGDTPLFLVKPLNDLYRFSADENSTPLLLEFDGETLSVPAVLLSQGATIKATVAEDGNNQVYSDWQLKKVDRDKDNDINSYIAEYKSKQIKNQKYSENSSVTVEIIPPEGGKYETLKYEFDAVKGKKLVVLKDMDFVLK